MAQKMTGALVFDERTDRYDIRFDLNSYMIRAPTFRRSTQRQEPHPPTTEYRRAAELTQRGDSRLYQRAVFLCGGIR